MDRAAAATTHNTSVTALPQSISWRPPPSPASPQARRSRKALADKAGPRSTVHPAVDVYRARAQRLKSPILTVDAGTTLERGVALAVADDHRVGSHVHQDHRREACA